MNYTISKTIIYIAIAIIATTHYSCIKDVDNLNLPSSQPKLVVQSFISPGDSIIVTIYASKPINYNVIGSNFNYHGYDTVKTATVTLTDITNGNSTTIPFDNDNKKYIVAPADFSIENNNEYELSITANTFKSITARTTVPNGIATATISKIDTTDADEWGDSTIRISGYINDPAPEENYYHILSYGLREYTWEEFHDIYLSNYSNFFITDNNHNGETINFRDELYQFETGDENTIYSSSILIYDVDEHYYKFHKSLETIYDIMDNPFTESSHLYSNIEGGLGVFGSFVKIGETNIEK